MNIPTLLFLAATAAVIIAALSRKLLVCVFAFAVILLTLGFYIGLYSSLDYDSDAWKAARFEGDYRICHRMRDDLIEKLSAAPLSSSRLREELGEPDYLLTPIQWRYRVKSADLIFPNDSFIHVWIENDVVSKIQYVRG